MDMLEPSRERQRATEIERETKTKTERDTHMLNRKIKKKSGDREPQRK